MNLKFHLLLRITLVGIFCLISTSAYVLYQSSEQSKQESKLALNSISKQLQVQLQIMDTGFQQAMNFPDFSLWKETTEIEGICLHYTAKNTSLSKSVCRGEKWHNTTWPDLFSTVYQALFTSHLAINKNIIFKGQLHGSISLTPSLEKELSRAWKNLRALITLSVFTIIAVCTLVYLSISQALQPASKIISGLQAMQQGHLDLHLPHFKIKEWQQTSVALNDLANRQKNLLEQRKKLSYQLMTLQDSERRYLARELHDELGQCLAAINALAASITLTAEQECPALLEETKSISRINQHIMQTVRELLKRLRPAEIDELGLESSLKNLVNEWNAHSARNIHYHLQVNNNITQLPTPLATSLFRIIQEALTNIEKHAQAAHAYIQLSIQNQILKLFINDDGKIQLPLDSNPSTMGIMGMQERITALGGEFLIENSDSGGLSLNITIPLTSDSLL